VSLLRLLVYQCITLMKQRNIAQKIRSHNFFCVEEEGGGVVIVLYPYDVGRAVCVERVGANPFGFAKAAYPAPLFSAIHYVAEWHTPQASYAKTLDVGSTLIHSSVLYCFALLICITQRKVSSFFLLLHPSLRSVCKDQEERVCCAALFLLLYSAKLCLASRPRTKSS
jgi:hypothetical protein